MIVLLIIFIIVAYIGLGVCVGGMLDCAGYSFLDNYPHAIVLFWPLILIGLLFKTIWLGIKESIQIVKNIIYNR